MVFIPRFHPSCLSLFADFQEPYAVVVLLEKDLVVIDLAQNGYVSANHSLRCLCHSWLFVTNVFGIITPFSNGWLMVLTCNVSIVTPSLKIHIP